MAISRSVPKLPAGTGLWPAFFLLPANGGDATELDVFEQLGSAPNVVHLTAHGNVDGAVQQSAAITVPDATTGFDTYGVDWEPTTITFYIDGQVVATMATPASMDTPMYMLVDLAVGGPSYWGGSPTSNAIFPADDADRLRAGLCDGQHDRCERLGAAIETSGVTGQLLMVRFRLVRGVDRGTGRRFWWR